MHSTQKDKSPLSTRVTLGDICSHSATTKTNILLTTRTRQCKLRTHGKSFLPAIVTVPTLPLTMACWKCCLLARFPSCTVTLMMHCQLLTARVS